MIILLTYFMLYCTFYFHRSWVAFRIQFLNSHFAAIEANSCKHIQELFPMRSSSNFIPLYYHGKLLVMLLFAYALSHSKPEYEDHYSVLYSLFYGIIHP